MQLLKGASGTEDLQSVSPVPTIQTIIDDENDDYIVLIFFFYYCLTIPNLLAVDLQSNLLLKKWSGLTLNNL